MRRKWVLLSVVALALVIAADLAWLVRPRTSEAETRRARVKVGMSEEEVDAVFQRPADWDTTHNDPLGYVRQTPLPADGPKFWKEGHQEVVVYFKHGRVASEAWIARPPNVVQRLRWWLGW